MPNRRPAPTRLSQHPNDHAERDALAFEECGGGRAAADLGHDDAGADDLGSGAVWPRASFMNLHGNLVKTAAYHDSPLSN